MRKNILITTFALLTYVTGWTQKIVAECTVNYSISANNISDKTLLDNLIHTTKTVYIKGNNCRTDLVSPAYTQSLLFDKRTGSATILREFGNNKFMTKLSNTEWLSKNNKFEGMTITPSTETKTILGYLCQKATLQLKDGNSYVLYYTSAIVPSVKDFEYQFKDITGFVLEYEVLEGSNVLKYTANKINLNPVPNSQFEVATTGYRLLNQ